MYVAREDDGAMDEGPGIRNCREDVGKAAAEEEEKKQRRRRKRNGGVE
jgi:hypothetical protein